MEATGALHVSCEMRQVVTIRPSTWVQDGDFFVVTCYF